MVVGHYVWTLGERNARKESGKASLGDGGPVML